MSKFQNDLTSGSVVGQLMRFSLPFLLSNLLQALYNMADMLIVSRFCGAVGSAAVSMGGQVTILVINLISGLAVGMKSSHAGHLVVLVVVVPKMLATGWRAMGALTLMPVAK